MARRSPSASGRAEALPLRDCSQCPWRLPAEGEVERFWRVDIPQAEALSIPAEQLQLGPVLRFETPSWDEHKCCRWDDDPSHLEILSSESPSLCRNETMDGGVGMSSADAATRGLTA